MHLLGTRRSTAMPTVWTRDVGVLWGDLEEGAFPGHTLTGTGKTRPSKMGPSHILTNHGTQICKPPENLNSSSEEQWSSQELSRTMHNNNSCGHCGCRQDRYSHWHDLPTIVVQLRAHLTTTLQATFTMSRESKQFTKMGSLLNWMCRHCPLVFLGYRVVGTAVTPHGTGADEAQLD